MPLTRRSLVAAPLAAALTAGAAPSPSLAANETQLKAARDYVAKAIPGLDPAVVDGAAAEGKVMLYRLLMPTGVDKLIAAFRAHFPFVEVDSYTSSGGPLYERFRTEIKAGRAIADLVMQATTSAMRTLASEKLLLSWTPPNDAEVPDRWKDKGVTYPVSLYQMALAWNIDSVTKAEEARLTSLKTWDDFLGYKWQSPLGIVHVRSGGTMHLSFYYLYKTHGREGFKTLASFHPLVMDSILPMTERLGAGEVAILPFGSDSTLAGQFNRGVPLRWVYPEPVLAGPNLLSIAANAPHPNAAKLFLAWSLTAEGQSHWVMATDCSPARAGIEDRRPVRAAPWYQQRTNYFDYSWTDISNDLPRIFEMFQQEFR
jgi:ABC-type Fe3+ transport system substrate-binding protein